MCSQVAHTIDVHATAYSDKQKLDTAFNAVNDIYHLHFCARAQRDWAARFAANKVGASRSLLVVERTFSRPARVNCKVNQLRARNGFIQRRSLHRVKIKFANCGVVLAALFAAPFSERGQQNR